MTEDTQTAVADKPLTTETPGVTPESPPETPAVPPGRLARFRAFCRRNATTAAFFVFLGVYGAGGTVVLKSNDLLTWIGVVCFVISILARRFLLERHTDFVQMLKLLGDFAAVTLIAAVVRDSFAGHDIMIWIGYVMFFVFCWVAARVFVRELLTTPESSKN